MSETEPSAIPDAASTPPRSLKQRSLTGAFWTIAGQGGGQGLRLVSNLILTRLLVPDAFGLMLLVNVFVMGLALFSEIGLGASVIQSRRGDERAFLDTIWTIQIVRGLLIFALACLVALPYSQFYGEPMLAELLPVAAIAAVISGFRSTAIYTLDRNIMVAQTVLLEIGGQLVGITVMIAWAYAIPTVWALVGGGLATASVAAVASHFIVAGPKNRLCWEKAARSEIVHFGKWILVATAAGFLVERGDRLIMGRIFSASELGMLSIALVLSSAVGNIIESLSQKVLLPVYSRLSDRSLDELRMGMLRTRAAILVVALPAILALALFSQQIIDFFWDPRYAGAGWMLEILAVGKIGSLIISTSSPVFLARGDSFEHMTVSLVRVLLLGGSAAIGGWLGGPKGVLMGVALTPFVYYPYFSWRMHKQGVWLPRIDLPAFVCSAGVLALALVLRG